MRFYPETIRGSKTAEIVEPSCGIPQFVLIFSILYSFLGLVRVKRRSATPTSSQLHYTRAGTTLVLY